LPSFESPAAARVGAVSRRHRPFGLATRQPRRPLFLLGSAEARVAVKAARFRTAFVQLRALRGACGPLVTAPLFRLCLETGIEAAIGAGSQRKDKCYDEPPTPARRIAFSR